MRLGNGQTVTAPLLQKLLRYAKEHFTAEERMMELVKYPALAAHRERHHALTGKVAEFMARLEKGATAINVELMLFLRDWLQNHIKREDKEYRPWLNTHGVN